MTDDRDDNLFLTQSRFSQDTFTAESDINSDFEHLLESDISNIDFVVSVEDDFEQNNSSDEELLLATQNFEKAQEHLPEKILNKESESRFGAHLTVEEITNLERLAKNKHTEKKSHWAVRVFDAWYQERKGVSCGLGRCLLNLSDDDLCRHLVSFITEVKNRKGEEYHGNTINENLSSVQYFLKQNGKDINIFSDFEFAAVRRILDAKMKALARRGIGIQKRKADVLTRSQEEKLLDTVFYLNSICFCLRGGAEHHELSVGEFGNFEIVMKNGALHLRYLEGVTKTNNGGLKHKNIPRKYVTVGPNTEHPLRCPVRLHEKYMSLRYKRTSEEMLQVVDDVVQGKVSNNVDTRPLAPKFFVASSSPSTSVTAKRFPTLPNIGAVSTAGGSAESTVANVSNAPISFTVERSGAKVTFQM